MESKFRRSGTRLLSVVSRKGCASIALLSARTNHAYADSCKRNTIGFLEKPKISGFV
jgi:hypothetical protein